MKSIVNGNASFSSCCIASNVWYYAVKSLEFVRQFVFRGIVNVDSPIVLVVPHLEIK
jgi:hypothetical protein